MSGSVNVQRKPDKQEKSLLLSHSARLHVRLRFFGSPLGWMEDRRKGWRGSSSGFLFRVFPATAVLLPVVLTCALSTPPAGTESALDQ